ncbi:hypothetical protein G5714_004417 [Onychostoma macrolepis]|uniref:Transposase n=1 Tax=Onychostoma macrolepis TaxID=369639 RepID=A0A7J6D5H2_9TELE|nr:hypothetical protein G5714_004417 [Onychostoma macrolepis]
MADPDKEQEKEQVSEGQTPAAKKKWVKFRTDWLREFEWLRLELALLSVQKENPMIGKDYNLLNMVLKTYHFSSKSMRELRALGEDLGVKVNSPSGVKGTRWLPRALETLLKPGERGGSLQDPGQFTAVYVHMDHLASASANTDIAGRAKKVTETSSSVSMEPVGFKRAVNRIQGEGIKINVVTTDRSPSIRKIMTVPDIHHEFDIWHVVKGM